jgi:hypothetical protein
VELLCGKMHAFFKALEIEVDLVTIAPTTAVRAMTCALSSSRDFASRSKSSKRTASTAPLPVFIISSEPGGLGEDDAVQI